MALSIGMSCVKYLLFCFNLLFAITGLIIMVAGIMAMRAVPYVDLANESFFTSAPVVLIVIGVIVFIVAFFGCCGAVKENHCMIITFSAFLLIIFVAELAVGIAGYVKRTDLEDSIMLQLNKTMDQYPTDKNVQNTFDILQTDLSCCGITSPSDWETHHLPYPDSCCGSRPVGTGAKCGPDNDTFHSDPCAPALAQTLHNIALRLGGVGIGIAFVQLIGVIFACCLARSIRSQYETV